MQNKTSDQPFYTESQSLAAMTQRKRASLAAKHLCSARYFASKATSLERKPIADVTDDDKRVHNAYVTGAVLLAAAFLDASIHELFAEAGDPGNPKAVDGLDAKQKKALAARLSQRCSNSLVKYRWTLDDCGKNMASDKEPWEGADALLQLRNALMHYHAEWSDDGLHDHAELESILPPRFPLSAFALPDQAWFPYQCLGAGCANWAANQAAEFVTAFSSELGIADRAK